MMRSISWPHYTQFSDLERAIAWMFLPAVHGCEISSFGKKTLFSSRPEWGVWDWSIPLKRLCHLIQFLGKLLVLLYKHERIWNWNLKLRTSYLVRNIVAFLIKLVQCFKKPCLELKMRTYHHSSLFYVWQIDLFVQKFWDAFARSCYLIHQRFLMVVALLLIWLVICPVINVDWLLNNPMKLEML